MLPVGSTVHGDDTTLERIRVADVGLLVLARDEIVIVLLGVPDAQVHLVENPENRLAVIKPATDETAEALRRHGAE